MSDNVVPFNRPKPTPSDMEEHVVRILTKDGKVEEVAVLRYDDDPPDYLKTVTNLMFIATWWIADDYAERFPDDPERTILLSEIRSGSRVNVYAHETDHPDAFEGKERLAWLSRRLNDLYQVAQPSWLEELDASGTISPSHSANIDQMEFSWSTTSGPSTKIE